MAGASKGRKPSKAYFMSIKIFKHNIDKYSSAKVYFFMVYARAKNKEKYF